MVVLYFWDEGYGWKKLWWESRLIETIQRKLLVYPMGLTSRRFFNIFIYITPNPLTLQCKKDALSPYTSVLRMMRKRIKCPKCLMHQQLGVWCTRCHVRVQTCFVVGMVSCYQSSPGPTHWRAFKRILWYLCETIDHALCFHGEYLRLTGYSAANWTTDKNERKSTSSYAFILGGGAVSWCRKIQSCIATFMWLVQ